MTAGSRIVIALIVLAFLGTGLYYLAISDEEGVSPAIAPAVSEPTPAPVSKATDTGRTSSPVAEQTLAFRVPVNPSDPINQANALEQLKVPGWRNVAGAPVGWYPIQRLDAFYSSDAQKLALAQDPATYLRERFGLIASATDDKLYLLLYGTSGKSLAPARRRGVDVMSVSLETTDDKGRGLDLELGSNTFEMLKSLQARNVSRSWAVLVDGMVVDVTRIELVQDASLVIGAGFSESRLVSIKAGILGTSKMVAARFVPAGPAPERELLLATSATIAPVTKSVEEVVTPPVLRSAAPVASTTGATKYVVQEGDTLAGISENWFGRRGKWGLVVAANPGMDPGRLAIGQVLMLPSKNSEMSANQSPKATSSNGTFVVRSGDSLSRISFEVYGSAQYWDLIYKANEKMIGNDPAALVVGQKLVIPPAPSK